MRPLFLLPALLTCLSPVLGQLDQPVETNWEGVTARLVLCHQDLHRTAVVVEWSNASDETVTGNGALHFKDIHLYDLQNDRKFFALKDSSGLFLAGPRSDTNDGGRWWIKLPPGETIRTWAYFGPLPADVTSVDVVIPQLLPFEGIPVETKPFPLEKDHPGISTKVQVSLVSAQRRPGAVSVRLRLTHAGTGDIQGGAVYFQDAYLYDYRNQRKYPLLRDAQGLLLAEPRGDTNDGGRWWINSLKPGGRQLMALTFQAPPDSVPEVAVVVPLLGPFHRVALSGTSGDAQPGGIEVVGGQSALTRILSELKAKEAGPELKLILDASVLFDHDQSAVRPAAETTLFSALSVIEEYPAAKVRIEGHTDSTGDEAYNQTLSEQRAASVRTWFIEHGCAPERLATAGFGETKPVASNQDEEGRQQNRRVEIILAR